MWFTAARHSADRVTFHVFQGLDMLLAVLVVLVLVAALLLVRRRRNRN